MDIRLTSGMTFCFSDVPRFSLAVILLIIADTLTVSSAAWYCRDSSCSAPLSEGIVGYNYNPPTKDAALNGYLSVTAGQNVNVYRVTQEPDILDIEVDGKRGFVPRTAIDVTKFFIENEQYILVQGSAPFEDAPYNPPSNLSKNKSAEQPADLGIPEVVSKKEDGSESYAPPIPPATADTVEKQEEAKLQPVSVPLATVNPDTEPEEKDDVDLMPDVVLTPGSDSGATASLEQQGLPVKETINDDRNNDLNDIKTVLEQKAADLVIPADANRNAPMIVESQPPKTDPPSVLTESLNKATPPVTETPAVTASPIETQKEIVVPPAQSAADIAPTAAVKSSSERVLEVPAVVKEAPVLSHPEPKVTFQAGDPFASLDQYYGRVNNNEQPRVVLTTALPHRHHHHHSHGEHGHGHGHHDHGHHDHKHGDHDHHNHAHQNDPGNHAGHSHDHHDHSHGGNGHDHTEIHDHAAGKMNTTAGVEGIPQQSNKETAVDVASESNKAVAPPSPSFIPPEDATKAPVDYQKIVQDRLDGKTVPGLLADHLDKDPHEGFPTPPPGLDPATATEPPVLLMRSDGGLRASEREAAIAANPRYQNRLDDIPPQRNLINQKDLPAKSEQEHSHHDHSDHDHNHDHSDHDHHHDEQHHGETEENHREHNHDHGLSGGEHEEEVVPVSELPAEVAPAGACSAKGGDLSDDVPCEDIVPPIFEDLSKPRGESETNKSGGFKEKLVIFLHDGAEKFSFGWQVIVREFEKVSADLRLAGMVIFALTTVTFMTAAASDRRIRRALENGFEDYDYKKESELVNLREQNKSLLSQSQKQAITKPVQPTLPPPAIFSAEMPRPCMECDNLRQSLLVMKTTISENEQVLKDHRDNQTNLLSKNNEVRTELRIAQKDRADLIAQLEAVQVRYGELERKTQNAVPGVSATNGEVSHELEVVRQQLSQARLENQKLHDQLNQSDSSSRVFTLQTERDEANSNVKFLKQLLAEKEEEIRKSRTAEASGSANVHREMQEKTEKLRSARRQLRSLQEEMDSLKRDREAQVQLRCQTFRNAADKAQRDALLLRHDAVLLRQQLEEVCRKYGESVPVLVNGAATPPGMIPPAQLSFAGAGFPTGPPPPTFEAFRQQVFAQGGGQKSGSASPLSPLSDTERRREKRNGANKRDVNRSGNMFDDSDEERRKNGRSHR